MVNITGFSIKWLRNNNTEQARIINMADGLISVRAHFNSLLLGHVFVFLCVTARMWIQHMAISKAKYRFAACNINPLMNWEKEKCYVCERDLIPNVESLPAVIVCISFQLSCGVTFVWLFQFYIHPEGTFALGEKYILTYELYIYIGVAKGREYIL